MARIMCRGYQSRFLFIVGVVISPVEKMFLFSPRRGTVAASTSVNCIQQVEIKIIGRAKCKLPDDQKWTARLSEFSIFRRLKAAVTEKEADDFWKPKAIGELLLQS